MRADGIACPFCVRRLEKKLKALPGAKDVHVDLESGLAKFDVAASNGLLPGLVEKAAIAPSSRSSADLCGNFNYIPSITRPGEDPFSGSTRRLQAVLESGVIAAKAGLEPDPQSTHVFLCGNPGMIQAAQEWFVARGFRPDEHRNPGNVHTEKYW